MDSTPDRMNKILECYVDFVEDADPMEEFPVVVHSPCHTAKHQLCEPDRSPRSRSPLMRLRSSNESLITQIVDRKVAVLKDEILTELRGELGKKRPLLDSGSDVFPKAGAYNLPMALGVTQTKQSTGASRASQEQSSVNTDMQVLKTGTEILQALDGFWDKFRTLGGHGRANVTATFCPPPPVVTAFDLKRRVSAMGIEVVGKGVQGSKMPWGLLGGQQGQPSISIQFQGSAKMTLQAHCRQGTLVMKGRRTAFTQDVVRLMLPYLGAVVSITASGCDI